MRNLTVKSWLFFQCALALTAFVGPANAGLLDKLTDSGPKYVELNDSSSLATSFKDAFTPKGPFSKIPEISAKSNKKVAVAGFQVEFATEQKGISRGNGIAAGMASTTDVVYTLKGTSDAQLQSIADNLHSLFVGQLKSKGYEIVPMNELLNTGYKDSLAKANQPPMRHERGAAIDLIFTPTEKEVDNASIIVTAKDTAPDVFARYTGGFGPGPGAADSLQANIVHMRVKVNFARFSETGFFNPEMDGKPQNVLSQSGTFMQVFSPGGLMTNFPLINPVVLPNRVADSATPVAATAEQTAQRAAGGIARAAGGFFFKGGISGLADVAGGAAASAHSVLASGNYEVVAGPTYSEMIAKDFGLVISMMLEAFQKQ